MRTRKEPILKQEFVKRVLRAEKRVKAGKKAKFNSVREAMAGLKNSG